MKFFNKALRILLITNGIILIAAAMLGPIYAIFVEEIGGDLLDAGFAGGAFAFAAGITTLVSGKYADKIKRPERIVVTGYFLRGIGFLLYLLVNSVWSLFLVQLLIGFAEAISVPAYDALYSLHLTKKKAGREWGAWEFMNYLTIAIGAVVGGLIADRFGFDTLFVVMSALCFSSALYLFFIPKRILLSKRK